MQFGIAFEHQAVAAEDDGELVAGPLQTGTDELHLADRDARALQRLHLDAAAQDAEVKTPVELGGQRAAAVVDLPLERPGTFPGHWQLGRRSHRLRRHWLRRLA